jgi:hypothetical protein
MRKLSMIAVGLLVGVWLMPVSSARAGEWVQVTCTQPNGQPAPIDGWQVSARGSFGSGSGSSNTCAQPGGALTALDNAVVTESAYNGPMWIYTAPAGSTIAGGSLTASLRARLGQAYVATPQNMFTDQADVVINCQYNAGACENNATETATVPIIPGGTQMFVTAMCVGEHEGDLTCPPKPGEINAKVSLSAADIELANSSTPTGTGFAGSLLAPAASGKASLTFSAQDPEGPGVYRVIVDLDGTAVYQATPDSNGGQCASIGAYASGVSEFLNAQPCKQNVAVDVLLDTTRFSNGQHLLKVTVQDAAGNTEVIRDDTISIANASAGGVTSSGAGSSSGAGASSIGPGSPPVARGAANGTNASDQATLTARWMSTAKVLRTSRYGVADRVTGRLTGPGGVGIGGAGIDVYETPAYHGAGTRRIGGVSTDPTGQWTLTLPRGVSSGALRFDYRSHQNDTVAAASATLRLSVHAGIALKIAPRSASVGRKIFFTGVLHGAPIPEGGKQLVLEARSGGEWIQFDTVRTNARGRYRATYRFKFPGPVTYQFRVLSRYEADFPFLDGTSNVVAVHEH